jgi:hypothetical protein
MTTWLAEMKNFDVYRGREKFAEFLSTQENISPRVATKILGMIQRSADSLTDAEMGEADARRLLGRK